MKIEVGDLLLFNGKICQVEDGYAHILFTEREPEQQLGIRTQLRMAGCVKFYTLKYLKSGTPWLWEKAKIIKKEKLISMWEEIE